MQHEVIIKGARERSFTTRAGELRHVIEVNMALPFVSPSGAEYTEEIVGSIPARDGLFEKLTDYVRTARRLRATFYMHTAEATGGSDPGGWFQRCSITNFAEEV